MDRRKVIDAVREILAGPRCFELERLERIHDALKPWTPDSAARYLERAGATKEPAVGMKWRSQTNFLPLVLDVFSQSMKVDNYLASDTKETASPWKWWQRNKFDARQTGVIRSVLEYGVAYTTVLPSLNPQGGQSGAFIRGLSPRQMTCLYGEPVAWTPGETPVDDDWPILALEIKDTAIRLYDEENVYFVGAKVVPQSAMGWKDPNYLAVNNFEFIEARPHGVGVCPVVRFRDRWLLDGEEQYGIIEPLINIQARIDDTTYQMSVAQYFTAFTERWVAGWRPQNDAEALAMSAGDVWYFSKADVKVGQFQAGDPKSYLDPRQSAIRDLAAIGQVPAQNLGLDALVNISEATLAGLETGKERKSAEIQTCMGESFEQTLRTCAHITGDEKAAQDFQSEVKWQDTTARSMGEQMDALVKMRQGLDVPEEMAWEEIPGWTKQKVDRARQLRKHEVAQMDVTVPQTGQPVPVGPPVPRPAN
ncbi:phage portal protein [Mycobacterium sp. 23]|uniref:phage portal protein n=1 Tax=Mycobacterium sp. 23 TaxID=3400424 RepID=UPI003AAF8146